MMRRSPPQIFLNGDRTRSPSSPALRIWGLTHRFVLTGLLVIFLVSGGQISGYIFGDRSVAIFAPQLTSAMAILLTYDTTAGVNPPVAGNLAAGVTSTFSFGAGLGFTFAGNDFAGGDGWQANNSAAVRRPLEISLAGPFPQPSLTISQRWISPTLAVLEETGHKQFK